ncbi:MAG: leucine-rich repeat protein [Clostridia bacterium]|nr:leucine-rich repeat protein [Clostridia bacterium]
MKRFLFLLLSLITLFSLISCGGGENERYRVMVSVSEGASVVGEASVEVEEGGTAEFLIEIDTGYVFKSVSGGVYDTETGVLTIENVTRRMNVSFYAEKADFDTEVTAEFIFKGELGDETNISENEVKLGTRIKAKSTYGDKIFLGWSFGKSFSQGGVIASDERDFEFTVTPDILKDGVLYLYANYMDNASRAMYYDANGGVINESSDNVSHTKYYETAISGSKLLVTLGDEYFSYCHSHSTFWDDGSFTREGYVLAEYNTKPDGSGEAYSLGSKFYARNLGGVETLYCIWKKATDASSFTFEDFEYPRPVKSEYAPDWQREGVIITGYSGADRELVIPETLGGKYVIAIAAGAVKNAPAESLVLNKRIQKIEDGAFVGCSSLRTIYYPDGLYSISNDAFDAVSYKKLKNLYVNATIAPRFSNDSVGAFSVKLSRLLEFFGTKRIIAIGGSSVYEGLGTEYMEALFDGEYKVINFGTTRTTHGLIYLEAMKHYATDNDLVIYAPENSIYMMGESELYHKSIRDLESMNNFYRYIDISNYTNVFSAFSDFNVNYRYKRTEARYEDIVSARKNTNEYGEHQDSKRANMDYQYSQTVYTVTLNDRVNSSDYDPFLKESEYQYDKSDWRDKNNPYWVSLSEKIYTRLVNHSISEAKSSGAKVVFAYCPVDERDMIAEAKNTAWLEAYEKLIEDIYDFDAALGNVTTYIYNHKYIYDSAFHLNDYGRTYRTYSLYCDVTEYLSLGTAKGFYDVGTNFEGCIFEENSLGTPKFKVDFLN